MNDASATRSREVVEAQGYVALARCEGEGTVHLLGRKPSSTLVGPWLGRSGTGITCPKKRMEAAKNLTASGRTARWGLRSRLIREEIIGHRMRAVRPIAGARFGGGLCLCDARRALTLLHQPAREHGGGIFLQPGIEHLADLFAEIGGMTKPRKFVALERIARSREQKLPRRLRLMHGHSILQEGKPG